MDLDPHGIILKGWICPGQYEVVGFLDPAGQEVLSLMVAVKYPGCVNTYSTTLAYISVLSDYLARTSNEEVLEVQEAWRRRRLAEQLAALDLE